MLEDPIYYDPALMYDAAELAGLARVRQATGIGMAITIKTRDQMTAAAQAGAVSAFNIEGTWPQLLERSAYASRLGLPFWAGSSVQSALSDLAMLHFAVTQPAFSCPFEMAGAMYRENDLIVEPLPLRAGRAAPFDAPGTGVTPDLDALERYRVGEPVIVGG
jgi:L-alanine-DL-glutamate epimerase-like enolase superfamily enzyme